VFGRGFAQFLQVLAIVDRRSETRLAVVTPLHHVLRDAG
jgi:hypothetical protein